MRYNIFRKSGAKEKALYLIMTVFFLLSLVFIDSNPFKGKPGQVHSSSLKKTIERKDNQTITYYLNQEGIITLAADLGYAKKTVTDNESGSLEAYFDENGEPVRMAAGYYAILNEYDNQGRTCRRTYLNKDGEPTNCTDGYALTEYEFDRINRKTTEYYYDLDGKHFCSDRYGFGKMTEYYEDGKAKRITFINESGTPMTTRTGYASILLTYYNTQGADNGKIKDEYYFDENGEPTAIYLGQYGVRNEYNELGQRTKKIYLNAEGLPTVTTKGHTSVVYSYDQYNNRASEQFFDISDNPFRLSEGQYGVSYYNGQEEYLNAAGNRKLNLRILLYNRSRIAILIAMSIVVIAVMTGNKMNIVLLILCVSAIAIMTLLFRRTGERRIDPVFFRLYRQALTNADARSDILRNIWLFIPLGTVLFRLCPKKRILLVPFIISIAIEMIQLLAGTGYCEPDDVISNTVGSFIGYLMAYVLTAWKNRISKSRKKICHTIQMTDQ